VRDINERLCDIQEAITKIMKYTSRGHEAFDQDELIQTWVIHHLEIIGEASRAIPQDFRNQHPEIEWKQISGMRNALIHGYFEINTNRVWDTITQDLPRLKASVDALLNTNSGEDEE
jgi:uncharacterized protein with HEPN domain